MERIDYLWDAWDECLCKTELKAEFDRLTAEDERLNEIIKNQSNLINDMGERGAALQSYLDKIREPIEQFRKLQRDSNTVTGTAWAFPCDWRDVQWVTTAVHQAIADYLNSQKPVEKRWPTCNQPLSVARNEKPSDSDEASLKAVIDAHGGTENVRKAAKIWYKQHASDPIVEMYTAAVDLGVKVIMEELCKEVKKK